MLWWAKALSGTLFTAAGPQFGTQWVSSAQGGAKALEKQHSEIAWGRGVSSPSSQALRHHFLHHHLCNKDARLNLLSGDRLVSPHLVPMQQPTEVGTACSRASSMLCPPVSALAGWEAPPARGYSSCINSPRPTPLVSP